MQKLFGAVLILLACGGCGFAAAAGIVKEERQLCQLKRMTERMVSELQSRHPPLSVLLRSALAGETGELAQFWEAVAQELDRQVMADAAECMAAVLEGSSFPPGIRDGLLVLGATLGRFDLEGQLRELEAVSEECGRRAELLGAQRDSRVRSCRALGLCAGAALAILLI